jgi:hypothetical protein
MLLLNCSVDDQIGECKYSSCTCSSLTLNYRSKTCKCGHKNNAHAPIACLCDAFNAKDESVVCTCGHENIFHEFKVESGDDEVGEVEGGDDEYIEPSTIVRCGRIRPVSVVDTFYKKQKASVKQTRNTAPQLTKRPKKQMIAKRKISLESSSSDSTVIYVDLHTTPPPKTQKAAIISKAPKLKKCLNRTVMSPIQIPANLNYIVDSSDLESASSGMEQVKITGPKRYFKKSSLQDRFAAIRIKA